MTNLPKMTQDSQPRRFFCDEKDRQKGRNLRQNVVMNKCHLPTSLLCLALATPLHAAAEQYVPWPSKDQLRRIQIEAFTCSRENQEAPCSKARSQADALMDHPRLPVICKDVLWSLVETATVAPSNNYKRRDTIDAPAKRVITICAEPVKKKAKPTPRAPKSTGGFGFGSS